MKITEVNATTQEVIERDMTTEELAQAEADKLLAEATKQAEKKAKAEAKAKRDELLSRLGITDEEAKLLATSL